MVRGSQFTVRMRRGPGATSVDLPGRPMLLGRMALRELAPPVPGAEHVVMGWLLDEDGRKVRTCSALYTAAGEPLAVAEATWIVVGS